jgi:proline-specific peptidase
MRNEGFIDVTGGRVWYARLGAPDTGRAPVLLLHGGPGAASDYVQPLAERLAADRVAIVYDQLGCGRSDAPDDRSLWTLDRSCAEVDQVRTALGLDHCHLFGQSWGGWLAIEYMTRGAEGITSLVLASTSASIAQFTAEARRLIGAMPEPQRTTILEGSQAGDYGNPKFLAAVDAFYRLHLCRSEPWPDALMRSVEHLAHNPVYLTMNGPTEFDVIGNLRDWDRTSDLGRIRTPTLVTCGRYDEITPACSETIRAGIPDAGVIVFEHSAHCAHLEEPESYAQAIESFLRRHEPAG